MAWERDILSLRVKCKKNEIGCDWIGQLRHYEVINVSCLNISCFEGCFCYDLYSKYLFTEVVSTELSSR